ncbi:MAG: hypothetical protein CMQ50_10305 [Gammaproteobacteria bacterium]|nr:hypothetical protein [Gammaproteobacteria bacterium]
MKAASWCIAIVMVFFGAYLLVFGNAWAPLVFQQLSGSTIGAWVELVVPLLPMVFIGGGAVLISSRRRRSFQRQRI